MPDPDDQWLIEAIWRELWWDDDLASAVADAVPLGVSGGWIVAWHASVLVTSEAAERLGLNAPMVDGPNARWTSDRAQLLEHVTDAADIGSVALILDIEALG